MTGREGPVPPSAGALRGLPYCQRKIFNASTSRLTLFYKQDVPKMTLLELLEDQRRCANRLWDPDMEERYLALQKELNKMAELSTLVIDPTP